MRMTRLGNSHGLPANVATLLLFAICFPLTVAAAAKKVIELTLVHAVPGAVLTYVQHNAARSDYPCADLKLKRPDGQVRRQSLCVFTDRLGHSFDIRKDVSFAGFENAKIDDAALRYTLNVSMRTSSDAFLLDCTVPYTAKAIGKQFCQRRERS